MKVEDVRLVGWSRVKFSNEGGGEERWLMIVMGGHQLRTTPIDITETISAMKLYLKCGCYVKTLCKVGLKSNRMKHLTRWHEKQLLYHWAKSLAEQSDCMSNCWEIILSWNDKSNFHFFLFSYILRSSTYNISRLFTYFWVWISLRKENSWNLKYGRVDANQSFTEWYGH